MIGRHGQVRPFELIRWARAQATEHKLKTLEAHVLLLLATYADKDGEAWPSIKTLALDSGLKPKRAETKTGAVYYTNSAISAALARLEDLQLIWSKQGGHAKPAHRELLFNPEQRSGTAEGSCAADARQPSASEEGTEPIAAGQPSGLKDAEHSGLPEQKYQENGHKERPKGTARTSSPAGRNARNPARRKGEFRQIVGIETVRSMFDGEAHAKGAAA